MTLEINQNNPFSGSLRFDSSRVGEYAERLLSYHGLRTDANATGLFARELEYIYTELYNIEYLELKARQFVPVDNRVPTGAEFYTYRQYDRVGKKAKIVHSYTDDAPTAELLGAEFPQRIVSLTSAYGYSIQDMRAAAMAGQPLETMKAEAARRMIEEAIEDLAAFGSSQILEPDGVTQMYGLLNAPNVAATAQTSSGTWQAQWNADTSFNKVTSISAMVADVNAMKNRIFTQTKGEHGKPGTLTLIVPTQLYTFLISTPTSITNQQGALILLEYLVKTCGLKEIDFWNRVDTAGTGGVGLMVMYEKNPRAVSLVIPQEFEQFAPQPINLGWRVPCHARCGAVVVRMPLLMTTMYGPST